MRDDQFIRNIQLDKKILKSYYRQISKNLYCSGKRKKRLLHELKTNIEEKLKEKPDLTYKELLEIYGTPKEIIDSYIESLDPEEYVRDMRRTKRNKWLVGILLSLVVAFAVTYLLHLTIVGWQTRPVSYTETIEIIEEN